MASAAVSDASDSEWGRGNAAAWETLESFGHRLPSGLALRAIDCAKRIAIGLHRRPAKTACS